MTKSDKVDKVLTHKIWGIPIFLVILFLVFHLTFSENLFYMNGFTEDQAWMPSLDSNAAFLIKDKDGNVAYQTDEETGEIVRDEDGNPVPEGLNYGGRWVACFYDGTVFSRALPLTIWNDMIVGEILDGGIGGWSGIRGAMKSPVWLTGQRDLLTTVFSKDLPQCFPSCRLSSFCSCSSLFSKSPDIWLVSPLFWTNITVNSVCRVVRSCP